MKMSIDKEKKYKKGTTDKSKRESKLFYKYINKKMKIQGKYSPTKG